MIPKPPHLGPTAAASFQDRSVVDAYHHRPPYPADVFDLLVSLIQVDPRHVLDIGCGTGDLARALVTRVARVDAVDCSRPMLEQGQRLPQGDHPHLRWLHGRAEEVELAPPYALVTAGESLHWMDWAILLPRLRQVLVDSGYLAVVVRDTVPDPWSLLGEVVTQYRTDGGYQPFNMIEQLTHHGLFTVVGEQRVGPVPFVQSITDCIESYHSRSAFSREQMGPLQALAFDTAARQLLCSAYSDGMIPFQVHAHIVWGLPRG